MDAREQSNEQSNGRSSRSRNQWEPEAVNSLFLGDKGFDDKCVELNSSFIGITNRLEIFYIPQWLVYCRDIRV